MTSLVKRLLEKTASTKRFLSKAQQNLKINGFFKRLWDKVGLQHVPQRTITKSSIIKAEMPHPFELATGLEKKEIQAFMEGNCDPYYMNVVKRGCGTADNPTLVPSAYNGRLVGCICNDNRFAKYMWLEKGCPKRCECGFWFKLKEVDPFP